MPSNTDINFTGITLDPAASVKAPRKYPKNILLYGDSIQEGVRTLGESAANDTDQNDGMFVWAYALGEMLGAEIGNIGFGGAGYTVIGSGNVPPLPISYNLIYQGASRKFLPVPDLVVSNHGTNDGSANTTSACITFVNGLISTMPRVPVVLLEPFPSAQGGQQEPFLRACQKAASNPSHVFFVSTAGFFNPTYGADDLNVHPSGPNSTHLIAPQVAVVLMPILAERSPAKAARGRRK